MKKRQKPVLFITLLFVMVMGALAVQYASDPNNNKPQPEAPPMVSETRKGDNSNLGASAAEKLTSKSSSVKRPPMGKDGPPGGLLRPEMGAPQKPKPSADGTTSAQWYSPESNK